MKPAANPLRIASGYSLHLYCKYSNTLHEWGEFPHDYFHELRSVCWRNARKAGWIIHRDRTATCPKCAQFEADKRRRGMPL